ncbi:hypothetical protein QUF84_14090 [Fictibacillus enclensis]|uniref:hypothetical protein n=1 Tax=Fictibacillus enclensis TaxID=1017270 RepID=UPI0025A2664A|nr:hypothetical protein [Fictibacillus enclensis]MDM5338348.1 hypothetical protein [Fictibacillus enclensis]
MMDSWIYAFFTIGYVILLLMGFYRANQTGLFTLGNLLVFVTMGLVYDNGAIAIGKWIGSGSFLEKLSFYRFVFHALFTPMLVLFSYYVIRESGVRWAKSKSAKRSFIAFTVLLIVLEIVTETKDVKLKVEEKFGALRYVNAESGGPPLMVLITIIPLLAAAAIMTAGSAIPLELNSTAVTNAFELILLISLWATKFYLDQKQRGVEV